MIHYSGSLLRALAPGFLCLVLFSCEKEGNKPGDIPDDIVFTDIEPDKQIATVKYFTPSPVTIFDCSDMPTPTDSAVIYDLDLDMDGQSDFRFNIAHSLYTSDYCGHCAVFTYSMSVSSLNTSDSIALSDPDYSIVKIFQLSDTVSMKNPWSERAQVRLSGGCALPFQTEFKDGFMGVKMGDKLGYIQIARVSNNGISILAHAFNKSENNPIVCGQTE